MEDWLPSERSTPTTQARASARPGAVTDGPANASPPRFSETLTSRLGTRPVATRPTRRLIRRDIMVRRVDPWTVLKISLVFYACMLIIGMLANAVLLAFINRLGLIDQATEIAGALNIALTINTGNILRALFLLGILGVVFWSAVNVFLAFLYNLVADLIGGVRVDLAEDE